MIKPTEEQLVEYVDKLGDNEIYWDYRDELSNEQMLQLAHGKRDEVEMELVESNWELLDEQREQTIASTLRDIGKKYLVDDEVEKRFKELVIERDKLLDDANLQVIAKNTIAYFVVVVNEPELSYQSWRGVENALQVAEIEQVFDLLNCNPAKLQQDLLDDAPHASETLSITPRPERDGHEYATYKMITDCLREATYGGKLTFLCRLDGSDLMDKPEGPCRIVVRKGTLGIIYDFNNGAGSCPDITLMRDLILEPDAYDFDLDSNYRYGVQSCYGFTDEPWKCGHVTFEKIDEQTTDACDESDPEPI